MDEIMKYTCYGDYKRAMDTVLSRTVEDFVLTGYILKQGRDTDILKESGYANVNEFAWGEYKLDATQVSRYIGINDRFSEGGCSPRLKEQYRGFGYTKLALMLTLPEIVAEELPVSLSKTEIQAVKEEIESEEKVTDIEVILEGEKEEQKNLDNLGKALNQIFSDMPELYQEVHELIRKNSEIRYIREVMAPQGDKIYSTRIQGYGRIMVYVSESKDDITIHAVRQGEKEQYSWKDVVSCMKNIMQKDNAKEEWSSLYGQQFPEKEEIAPVQPKEKKKAKPRKESKVVKAKPPKKKEEHELPNDIPGQTEIAKDFPELLPEKEENCTSANVNETEENVSKMPESVTETEENVSKEQENVINTQENVTEAVIQQAYKGRKKYMETLSTYEMALYIAASIKTMPHMMLNSPDFWFEWLGKEVDEKGEEIEIVG